MRTLLKLLSNGGVSSVSRQSHHLPATKRIANSKTRFENIVWPEIRHWFGGGELVPGESVDERVAELLDQEAGVDFYAVIKDEGVITIASRCQKTPSFQTTTVRYDTGTDYDTELQKRLRQLDCGMLSPLFTVHAYVKLDDPFDTDCVTGSVRNVAACRTVDLFNYIDDHDRAAKPDGAKQLPDGGGWYVRKNSEDDNLFLAVPWQLFSSQYDLRVRYRNRADLPPPERPRRVGTPWWKVALGVVGGDTDD